MHLFEGVGVALVTPFDKEGAVDFAALERVIEFVIRGKIDYLVVLGTTGETSTLSEKEQQEILEFTLQTTDGRRPVVAGIGGNYTAEVVRKLKSWNLDGVDGILSVTPSYNKPTQEGLYAHFAQVAQASPLPVMLYNVPPRTSCNLKAETTLRLAEDFKGQITGIKEASGDMVQAMHLVKGRPEDFLLISGDDLLAMPLIAIGFNGVVSVVANAFPGEYAQLIHMCQAGKYEEARPIMVSMMDKIEILFAENSPAGVKAFLSEMKLIENHLRLPLVPLSSANVERVKQQLYSYSG